MKYSKACLIIATALLMVNVASASPRFQLTEQKSGPVDQFKVLSEGSHSEVTKPFLAVVREPGAYAELRKLARDLPILLDDFFKQNLVVAAFMGERNTGGYSVQFTRAADGVIHVSGKAPGKGAMVTQALTTPFKVISIPTGDWNGLEAADIWQQATTTYRVSCGDFAISGGFAGTREAYKLQGLVGVLRERKLATFIFDLQNSTGRKRRALSETISSVVQSDQTTIYVMRPGSLVSVPHSNLTVTGKFSSNGKTVEMYFKSLPSMIVADGYAGEGWLEAEVERTAETSQGTKK